jgi:hypothetical protein
VPLGDSLPKTLSCTGLYGAAGTGTVDKAVPTVNREFNPGTALWTDGAEKRRWIALPDGTKIDTSNPGGWVFPNGTRVWKEFKFNGKRAETRFMYKHDDLWLFATYKWNETDTEATAVDGADVALVGGGTHSIPNLMQCNECHRGSRDKLLGFEQVLLGLPGAEGFNLTALVAENRLSNPPARTNYVIPDDGTGVAAKALSWIHVNCGVSCHNETGNAQANMSHMFLRIDPTTLDAASPAAWNIVKLTVGVPSVTANFRGVRIVPGLPDQSLIVQLAQTRGSNMAMPPIGTRIVDPTGIANVRDWITRLGGGNGVGMDGGAKPAVPPDTGAPTPTADAALADAGQPDADSADAGVADADVPDAELPDAELPDAELPDAELPDAEVPPVVVQPPVVAEPPVVTPPVVEPPVVTPPVVEPPVVTPPVVEPPVTTPPVVEAPVT